MLKRILPFVLTLLAGLALWSAISSIGTRPEATPIPTTLNSKRDCLLFNRQLSALNDYDSPSECSLRARGSFSNTAQRLQIIDQPAAEYTRAARRNETEGTVRLRVKFGADGRVANVHPLETLPDGLTEQAIKAARKTQFVPEMLNGAPVTVEKTIEYNFEFPR